MQLDGHLAVQSVHDVTGRKAWDERQRMLLRELTHRLKNTLMVVLSIARQTMIAHPAPEEFVNRFDGRLRALSDVHGLLDETHWEGVDLAELVQKLLEPYAPQSSARYLSEEGEPFALPADLATSFSLVLHELATNAAKYGSLSQAGGIVVTKWSIKSRQGERILEFIWEERGGPPAREPQELSIGSALIENLITDSTVRREFRSEGLLCTIQIPV